MQAVLQRLTVALAVVLIPSLSGVRSDAEGNYEARLARFKQSAKSNSLAIRTAGQEQLAASQDPRAITVLGARYGAPRAPKAQGRHLVVSTLARHFDSARFVLDLGRLRKKYAAPEDAWLWYRTLVIHGRHAGAEELWRVARDVQLPATLRAAAVEAAVTLAEPGVADLAVDLLADLPAAPAERAVLVRSLATGLLGDRDYADEPVLERAADGLIAALSGDGADAGTRVVVGRVLKDLLESRFAYLDGDAWREHKVRPGATRKSAARRLRKVRCAAVASSGARIAYLIDASDGATQPVTEDDQDRLLDTPKPMANRLALMQHVVRESIRGLAAEQSFVVLYYAHHNVGVLPGLGQLLPATYENKLRAFEALDAIPVSGPGDLHAGLMKAYQAHARGFVEANEHCVPATLLGGCDTLFVLNHGSSHHDQWIAKDPSKRKERARTLPSGSMAYGIYADPVWLGEELRRWRLFRKVRLHTVPFGAAHHDTLETVEREADAYGPPPAGESGDSARGQADARYLAAKKAYVAYLRRPSLSKRTLGRSKLAATESLLALQDLARDYAHAEEPVPIVQQLLVDISCRDFRREEALPIFARWRGRHATRTDAWLWHRALDVAREHDDVHTPLRAATEAHDPFLRAAAIRALAKQRGDELLEHIPAWVAEVRAAGVKGLDRLLPVEAMATALAEFGAAKDEDGYKTAALALLDVFDDEATPTRTKLTIVRNLAYGLGVPPEGLQKEPWVREARAGGSGVGMADTRYGAPTFGGLRASGTRLCYVIDMSDSMLKPLAPNERLRPRVVTGAGTRKKRRPEDEINWAALKNRFDLARALLITSLQSLRPNTHFCVIWFGTDAGTLRTTKGLVPTTPANVARTVKELRGIRPGPVGAKGTGIEWGSLEGETNLHGGLTRAFVRTAGKVLGGFAYVSGPALEHGCDTIFLLSDGTPTTDDFVKVDKRDPEDHAVTDRETMKRTDDVPELSFPGPYGNPRRFAHLLNDIERRNLFRQVEIHCLGIGEANMGLLGALASLGLGESRKIGRDAAEEADK